MPYARSLGVVLSAGLVVTAEAQTGFALSFDSSSGAIGFDIDMDTEAVGTLRGDYDQTTNPDGTRTVPGLFGGDTSAPRNEMIDFSTNAVLEYGGSSPVSGDFNVFVDEGGDRVILTGLSLETTATSVASGTAFLNDFTYANFRTLNPDSTFIFVAPIDIEQPAPELTRVLIVQEGAFEVGELTVELDGSYSFSADVPVVLTIEAADGTLGDRIEVLPLSGTIDPTAGTASVDANLNLSDDLSNDGIVFEDVPVTVVNPLNNAEPDLLLNIAIESGTLLATSDGTIVASEVGDAKRADRNGDGVVNVFDLLAYFAEYRAGVATADENFDGVVNVFDLLAYFSAYRAG